MLTNKKIAIDARMIQSTGIGTYSRGLLNGFRETGMNEVDILTIHDANLEILKHFKRKTFNAPIYSIQEQVEFLRLLKGYDLLHCMHYNIPYFKPKRLKLVATVHDLIHWIYRKEYFGPIKSTYAKIMFKRVVNICDHVIVVSEHTKKDLIKYFQAEEKKITVIHESVSQQYKILDQEATTLRDQLKQFNLPANFFLFVGSLKPHKNLEWLVSIFEKLHLDEQLKYPLLILGNKDLKYPHLINRIENLQKKGIVIHLEGINDEDLVRIYNLSTALIHPSLYEGFGLTILEAMACGAPVITCPNASLPEVAGEAAWMVDSSSDHGMMQAILTLAKDESLREAFSLKGQLRVKEFSWQKTALETLNVYEKVLSIS